MIAKISHTIYKLEKTIVKIIFSFILHFFIGFFTIITIFPKYFIIGIVYIISKDKRNEINKTKSKIPFIMMLLAIIVYLICIFLFSRWSVQQLKIKYLTNDIISSTEIIEQEENQLIEEIDQTASDLNPNNNESTAYYPNDYWDYLNVAFIDVDFDSLLTKNSDTVGWIKVNNTKINYPIVQSSDNDYYLNHAFNNSKNAGGWIFADYRADFVNFGKNTIIYGHNLNNKTMFGSLPNTLSSNWLNNSDNHYIKISTPTANTVWKVFSLYIIEPETYYLRTIFTDDDYQIFIDTLKSRSIYDFDTDITINDKILTLSTCDNTGTKRVVMHAKMANIEYK